MDCGCAVLVERPVLLRTVFSANNDVVSLKGRVSLCLLSRSLSGAMALSLEQRQPVRFAKLASGGGHGSSRRRGRRGDGAGGGHCRLVGGVLGLGLGLGLVANGRSF